MKRRPPLVAAPDRLQTEEERRVVQILAEHFCGDSEWPAPDVGRDLLTGETIAKRTTHS